MRNEVGLVLTGQRVLVRLPKIERTSKGGIALPDIVHDKESKAQLTGILVDVADDAKSAPELKGVTVGDVIFFARYAGAGFEWTTKDVPYRVMNAADVVGKFEADAPGLDSQFRAALTSLEAFGVNTPAKAA